MFAWLVTMVLHESPQLVGIAQMTMLIPTMLLILVGGSLADVIGARRIVVIAQSVAVLPPLFLMVVVWTDQLSFHSMICVWHRDGARAGVRDAGARWIAQSGRAGRRPTRRRRREHDAVRRTARRLCHCIACRTCRRRSGSRNPRARARQRRRIPRAFAESAESRRPTRSPAARPRPLDCRRLSNDRSIGADAHDGAAELCDGIVFHGVVHRHAAAARARGIFRDGRRSCTDEHGQFARPRHDDSDVDAVRRHSPTRTRVARWRRRSAPSCSAPSASASALSRC